MFFESMFEGKPNQQLSIITRIFLRRCVMGKYFIGWLVGIPVIVLVIIYLVFNH